MFFDFHVHKNDELPAEAIRLGYSGIALVNHSENRHPSFSSPGIKGENSPELPEGVKVFDGMEILAKNPDDLRKKIQKVRKRAEVLLVHGGDLKINRATCENPRADILSHPYRSRRDSGINHVIGKKAAENKVAIELNLKYLFKLRHSHRYRVLSHFRDILKLQRKFEFPLIITSGAHSIYDLHTPQDIMALTSCFGMSREETICALSETPQNIIERSKERSSVLVEGARLKSR